MSDHRKSGVAFWATVLLVIALMGYPMSYSPVCRLVDWGILPDERTKDFYGPLLAIIARSPEPAHELAVDFARLFASEACYSHGVWWILTDPQWRKW